jgi:peptide/nickel transport system substrate-binding protein
LYQAFEQEFQKDLPAVFVYSPAFLYIVPPNLKNTALAPINTPAERFLNIHEWYINTVKVWKIFAG